LSTPAPKVAQLYTEMVGSNALFVGYISLFFKKKSLQGLELRCSQAYDQKY